MSERYEIVGPLGTGGMAEVLLARRAGPHGFERLLAVKRIRPELAHDPDMVRMLLDEARNAASLVHQRIVQVFDIDMREGSLLYAMEYLHGKTLDEVLARAPALPFGTALAVAIAVADGLHYAHSRAIVHRDVAPSNVMITYDGNVKLIDFGIAKAAGNLSSTIFGTFKGRLGYSSPEQCRCEQADLRTDIYSLGVMLYEMTTGRRAFSAATENDLLKVMEVGQIAPPTTFDSRYPRELEAIVMKALAPDRARRYPTAEALHRDLETFARAHGLNISDGALARMMHELFAEELAPWLDARKTGVTLDEHVVREVIRSTIDAGANATTLPAPTPARKQAKRRGPPTWIPIAIIAALLVVAFVATRLLLKAG